MAKFEILIATNGLNVILNVILNIILNIILNGANSIHLVAKKSLVVGRWVPD